MLARPPALRGEIAKILERSGENFRAGLSQPLRALVERVNKGAHGVALRQKLERSRTAGLPGCAGNEDFGLRHESILLAVNETLVPVPENARNDLRGYCRTKKKSE